MASISFEYSEDKLILCYAPSMGFNDITKRLDTVDPHELDPFDTLVNEFACQTL